MELWLNKSENIYETRSIILREKRLNSIDISTFKSLKSLEILDLSFNNLSILVDNSFMNSSLLTELYLRNNRFKNFNKQSFFGLGNLKTLDLSNNELIKLFKSDTFLNGLTELRYLNLENNQIQEIDK